MPRIPDHELESLKREADLVRLAEARGVELKRHGADLIGRCPFHDDREPSLVITPSKGLWNCLGECRRGGSAIDWVMRAEGVSFRHAVQILKNGIVTGSDGRPPKRNDVPVLSCPLDSDADDVAMLRDVVGYYHATGKTETALHEFLSKRGIDSPELIERFQIGYANRTLGLRLPAMNRREGALLRAKLAKLGVMRDTGREHFYGCAVFPVIDEAGDVVEIYGRRMGANDKRLGPPHLYLPGPHAGVWNWQALAESKEVILCESIIDAATFWVHGFHNVIASYGINGFTDNHLEALKIHSTRKILIAYDADDAGNAAAVALAEKLLAEGIECYRVHFPKGMDANEYALKVQPADKALDLVIRKAEWMGAPRPNDPQPVASPLAAAATPPAAGAAGTAEEATKEKNAAGVAIGRTSEDEGFLSFDDRRYRLRGLAKLSASGPMRLNVMASREGISFEGTPMAGFHVDSFDLYSARQRGAFEKQAAGEIGAKVEAVRHDVGKIIRVVEELQREQAQKASAPKAAAPAMSDEEKADALELLCDENLLGRISADLARCGLVGEETNGLVAYLVSVSRLLERPLAVIVQSSSAAGKSFLMDQILAVLPPEAFEKYAAMSGQALFYFDENKSLKHKVLAISEEEGAETASYALKILQSEGMLKIASTGKDGKTGAFVTKEYFVEGPVVIFLTTTSVEIDEELRNRCLVLTVDESREQTRRIHDWQREQETIEGILAKAKREKILALHRNAQRLLRSMAVANPFSTRLSFLDAQTRTRRDNPKYLALIRAIALLHQHQRERKIATADGVTVEYIEATAADVAVANKLSAEVFGRSLDELPPQTRRFLELVHGFVVAGCEHDEVDQADWWFTRRQIREHTGWSSTQIRIHLDRLIELEYVLAHRGARGQSYVYELLYGGEGRQGERFLVGLSDAAGSADFATTTTTVQGQKAELAGSKRGQNGPKAGGWRGLEMDPNAHAREGFGESEPEIDENELLRAVPEPSSYSQKRRNGEERPLRDEIPPAILLAPTAARPPNGSKPAAEG